MPIRSFNYTGRRRITREEVQLRLSQLPDKTISFDADIRLEKSHMLPDDAAVCVEAYRGSSYSWMRFPFGKVGDLRAPADRRLTDFDGPEGILFRIKVTSPTKDHGLILAEADALSPRTSDEKEDALQSLLPVRSDKNLGSRVWRIDFEDKPVLLVNSALGEWRDVVRDRTFMTLVMPTVLEAILVRILLIDKEGDQDEEAGDWRSQWLRFIRSMPVTADLPDIEDKDALEHWIEEAVGAFSRKQRILDRFEECWNRSDR